MIREEAENFGCFRGALWLVEEACYVRTAKNRPPEGWGGIGSQAILRLHCRWQLRSRPFIGPFGMLRYSLMHFFFISHMVVIYSPPKLQRLLPVEC